MRNNTGPKLEDVENQFMLSAKELSNPLLNNGRLAPLQCRTALKRTLIRIGEYFCVERPSAHNVLCWIQLCHKSFEILAVWKHNIERKYTRSGSRWSDKRIERYLQIGDDLSEKEEKASGRKKKKDIHLISSFGIGVLFFYFLIFFLTFLSFLLSFSEGRAR